jgi:GT2 family glycosyltransferase/glycosyltransferase involved in cell wall biosynthesis
MLLAGASREEEYPTVSVIVLNYNGLRHLNDCFTSLLALDYPSDRLELMLVDNGSSDESLQFMRDKFPSVRLVETGSNLGFAAGNDFGAERANGEYVAFLNNDTRVERDWLLQLVRSLLAGRDEGVICASSLMLDWSGKRIDFQAGGLNFHGFGFQPSYGLPVEGQQIKPRELLFACGGSMLIRRDVFLHVGGFDPDYFAFFEDVDLGWRLWLLGYKIVLAPASIAYHRHHGTAENIAHHRVQVLYERNALYTIFKNYEGANLERILSAALLLLGQRTARFMELGGVDFADYDLANTEQSREQTENVHRNAVATLLAANEFMDNLDHFRSKRDWIQANRKRSDAEMFALFGQPGRVHLLNHEADAPYSAAHFTLLHELGIEALWSDLPKEVLVISPDVLPVGDIPASGSGIRAWALGKGLESRGHHVRFTMPAAALHGREEQVPDEYAKGAWTPETLQAMVDALAPDVIVSCGWPNLTWLNRANLPVALDLTGPHLLERAYQEYRDVHTNAQEKLAALARADYFTCISQRQKYYFTGWLAQAGVEVEDLYTALSVIPYSLSPEQPTHHWPHDWDNEEVRFIYGGIFLPWQNPAPALLTVADALEDADKGILEVIGGKHPFHAVNTGGFGPLVDRLSAMSRVRMSGLLPHDELVERYTRAHVAVDVMMPNAERELAFPSRTIHYMWCGLPVIHPAFSEVAEHIIEYEAGWIVPHDDPEALCSVVIGLLANSSEIRRRGENAKRLARERFSWDSTVEQVDRFVRQPYIRKGKGYAHATETTVNPTNIQEPAGYVIAASDGRQLPLRLQKLQEKRRDMPTQVLARSRALLRELVPVEGGRARPTVKNGQRRYRLPELIAGHSHGQRFLCPHNGLSGVRLPVITGKRQITSRVTLHLRAHPAASTDLYAIEVPTYRLKDGQEIALRFPRIEDSGDRWFYLVAESPDGAPGDAISLWATEQNGPIKAQRYEDALPATDQLVMSIEINGAAL